MKYFFYMLDSPEASRSQEKEENIFSNLFNQMQRIRNIKSPTLSSSQRVAKKIVVWEKELPKAPLCITIGPETGKRENGRYATEIFLNYTVRNTEFITVSVKKRLRIGEHPEEVEARFELKSENHEEDRELTDFEAKYLYELLRFEEEREKDKYKKREEEIRIAVPPGTNEYQIIQQILEKKPLDKEGKTTILMPYFSDRFQYHFTICRQPTTADSDSKQAVFEVIVPTDYFLIPNFLKQAKDFLYPEQNPSKN